MSIIQYVDGRFMLMLFYCRIGVDLQRLGCSPGTNVVINGSGGEAESQTR